MKILWLPDYLCIYILYVFHSTAQVVPCWPCPPHGPLHGLGVCSNTSPLRRPFSHLRSLSVEPSVLPRWVTWPRCGTLVALVAGFKPKKMDGIPPSHLVMVMFYRDQMTINQWIFRETLLTKPQRPQKRSGKNSTGCAFKSLGFQGDLKHLIPIFSCHNEAFASGDFLDASWRNVLEETTSYPLHFEKVYNIPRISLVTST